MDEQTKFFSNNLNTLEHNIAKLAADASSENDGLGYRSPEIIRLGNTVKLVKQTINGHMIGNEGWWVWNT